MSIKSIKITLKSTITLCLGIILIIATISTSDIFSQKIFSSIELKLITVSSSLTSTTGSSPQLTNSSDTIQCITTPCEIPTATEPVPPKYFNNTIKGPKNATTIDDKIKDWDKNEPCISPCPPGEICIQMCKPIGQPDIPNSDRTPLNEQGETIDSTYNSKETTSPDSHISQNEWQSSEIIQEEEDNSAASSSDEQVKSPEQTPTSNGASNNDN